MADSQLGEEIRIRFSYHAPTAGQVEKMTTIRAYASEFADELEEMCPASRELSIALTHLETAVMFANAAIVRREVPTPGL